MSDSGPFLLNFSFSFSCGRRGRQLRVVAGDEGQRRTHAFFGEPGAPFGAASFSSGTPGSSWRLLPVVRSRRRASLTPPSAAEPTLPCAVANLPACARAAAVSRSQQRHAGQLARR